MQIILQYYYKITHMSNMLSTCFEVYTHAPFDFHLYMLWCIDLTVRMIKNVTQK